MTEGEKRIYAAAYTTHLVQGSDAYEAIQLAVAAVHAHREGSRQHESESSQAKHGDTYVELLREFNSDFDLESELQEVNSRLDAVMTRIVVWS